MERAHPLREHARLSLHSLDPSFLYRYSGIMPIPLLLHGKHAAEVRYEPFGPWIVPWRFHSLEEEYRTLRTAVGLTDASTYGTIRVEGTDRASFLHNLLTNDIKRLAPGSGCRAALLDPSAHLLGDLLVLADAEAYWLLCDATCAAAVADALCTYIFSEQVRVTNLERSEIVLALQGPRTMELLIQLTKRALALPQLGDQAVVSWAGVTIRLIRNDLIGDVGVCCLVRAEEAEMVWKFLQVHGLPSGLRLVGWEAFNTARIEAGYPWYGIDMGSSNLLPETGLQQVVVSETKGCYIGQEIVARVQTYGSVNKRFVGLLIEAAEAPAPGAAIHRAGEVVGTVTSACVSPALGRPIAMGYVKRGAYDPGTVVDMLVSERPCRATVAPLPFLAKQQ